MEKIDTLAYNEGRKAYFRGGHLRDNPYVNNPEAERKEYSWDMGFERAHYEEEIEYDFNAD